MPAVLAGSTVLVPRRCWLPRGGWRTLVLPRSSSDDTLSSSPARAAPISTFSTRFPHNPPHNLDHRRLAISCRRIGKHPKPQNVLDLILSPLFIHRCERNEVLIHQFHMQRFDPCFRLEVEGVNDDEGGDANDGVGEEVVSLQLTEVQREFFLELRERGSSQGRYCGLRVLTRSVGFVFSCVFFRLFRH